MKKVYSILFILVIAVASHAQTEVKATPAKEVLLIKETKFDFGKIPQGKPVTHIFEVVNTTNEPLQIENVQASCGCTTPEWNHDPVAPGATKKITVGYNAAANGPFEKTITIFYDSGKTKQLFIKGEVWQTPAEPAPANASVQLLKNINH
ncbi:MAG: DUF1573 domain-containing protein [Agriterribacter sp.]